MNPEGADRPRSRHLLRTLQGRGEEEMAFLCLLVPAAGRPPRPRLTPAGPGTRRCSPGAERAQPRPGPGPAMAAPPRSNQPPPAAQAHSGPRAAPARAWRGGHTHRHPQQQHRPSPPQHSQPDSAASNPRPNSTLATGPLRATSLNTCSDSPGPPMSCQLFWEKTPSAVLPKPPLAQCKSMSYCPVVWKQT